MAYFYRKLIFSGKNFKYDKVGFSATRQLNSKSFFILQNTESQLNINARKSKFLCNLNKKYSLLADDHFSQTQSKRNKYAPEDKFVPGSKIVKLNLPKLIANADALTGSLLTSIFSKILVMYFLHNQERGFQKYFENFLNSWEFKTLCDVTEKKLRTLKPSCYLVLLYLHYINISPSSIFMRKVLTSIMDNFNYYNMCEIFHLHSKLSEDVFKGSKESDDLKKVCNVYFNEVLEEDLSHCWDKEDLIYYLQDSSLPEEIRFKIAKRVFEILKRKKMRRIMYIKFYRIIFHPPFYPHFKSEVLGSLKDTLFKIRSVNLQLSLFEVYREVVNKNNDIYDESVIEIFRSNAYSKDALDVQCFLIINKLTEIGYYDREGLESFAEFVTNENILGQNILRIANTCARNFMHEADFVNWEKLKSVLENFFIEANFYREEDILKWCSYLTFLQCDSRSLLSKIFDMANQNDFLVNFEKFRSLLQLHHLANKYYSSGYTKITEPRLKEILKLSMYKKEELSKYRVEEVLGDEKYLLTNCFTSNYHLLHMVAVFGKDNMPIDLSYCTPKDKEKENNKLFHIEDIQKPEGAKVVAFQEIEDYQPLYFRNRPDLMSGIAKLCLKSLEDCGCELVLMPLNILGYRRKKRLEFIQAQLDKILGKV